MTTAIGGYLVLGDPLEHLAAAVIDLANGQRYLSQSVAGRVVDSLLASPLTQRETEVLHPMPKEPATR